MSHHRNRGHGAEPRHSPKGPVRRSKSLNLRTPFYLDKEDYYSDGGSTCHAVEENEAGKKHKEKGHKKRSTKRSVSRSGSSALYANEQVKRHRDKSKSKSKRGKKSKKNGSSGRGDRSDDGYESPPIDYDYFSPMGANTLDRTAGTNGTSVPLHVSTNYQPRSPTIYLTPPGEATTAFPHMPRAGRGITENGQSASASPKGHDSLYAKPHKKHTSDGFGPGSDAAVVIETSPTEPTGLSARRDSSPLLLHTVEPRQSVLQAQGHLDTADHHEHVHQNGNNHYANSSRSRQADRNMATTAIDNNVIETTPHDNSEISDMVRGSPTRKSAIQARHPDGSPFLLHTADSSQVEKQLKEHPEDGADVLDHVISFRCYDSPIPREDLQLFRNSTRRSGRSRKSGRSRASQKSSLIH